MGDTQKVKIMSKQSEKLNNYLFLFIIIATPILIYYATETICKNIQKRLESKQYDSRSNTLRL
jgi:hypothetical protein